MNAMRSLTAAIATVVLCACATGGARSPAESVARLEKDRAAHPTSAPAMRAVGIAYYDAKRFPEARMALGAADVAMPNDGVTALYRGLTAEALNDFAGAKGAYTKYLAVGKTAKVRKQIRDRLAAVARNELAASAKSAVARETELASEPGPLTTVAVPPLTFSGADTSLLPLERGVADLLITDLSRSKQLTVLERDRMQALLDEVQRSEAGGRVDAATAVRAGKMLRAGSLIRGSIIQTASTIQMTTTVVNVSTSAVTGSATGDDQLDALFDLEKRIALQIFDNLGVKLTDAERTLVQANRPTRSLNAFLAFSRGLIAEDRGDFFEAARLYESAGRIDPGFGAAALKQSGASSAAAGASVSSATVSAGLKGSAEGAVVGAASNGVVAAGDNSGKAAVAAVNDVNPSPSVQSTASTTTHTGGDNQPGGSGSSGPGGAKPAAVANPSPVDGGSGRVVFIIRPPEE